MNIHPSDFVLEVGFGPGLSIQKVASIVSQGWVAGIDFSKKMVKGATKRNAAVISAGRVELKHGNASSI